ncbi:hypothetical protein HPG69_004637 [Diceros bicornis minor]|uniref:F5/8 type C domain-containing protein n=1 Tax=Diceros bicornis minor TaxID=77932 RepID=A0A7J7E408_DICBM|nr:hypothetical protein HPG69_004637 [Diceros bicornis minor]
MLERLNYKPAFQDHGCRLMLQVFQANNDATEVVLNKLHSPLLTRFVRVRPQTWHSGIALRLELFGCRVTGQYRLPSENLVKTRCLEG